ncbi:hypothetical protein [Serinicoccus hydrothermalis]|uniref:hypothetical protein n=1 Tax=Serinicoccus hydrothermalis TaxID=1758689 RepID=UPI0012F7F608|nr:hypothetical protein [Serinicoccus hydrothermalis]
MTEDDFVRCLDGLPLDADADLAALLSATASKPAAHTPPRLGSLRSVPLADRPVPTPPKPPRPLRRERVLTDQACSVDGCSQTAAFKTRSKPTYCDTHVASILKQGGLEALESFTRPDDWLLTRCLRCGNVAHYRFVYVIDKNEWNEATCRACYWREWAQSARALQGPYANVEVVPYERAQEVAEENGYIYLGPLTKPSLPDDPHRTECRRCGKISAERLGDIQFGCTCQPRK